MNRGVRTNGERIVQLRLENGWTQEHVAGKCDLAVNTVRSAERGGPVAVTVVNDLASFFEVAVKELLAGNRPDPAIRTRQAQEEQVLNKLAGKWIGKIEQPTGPDGQHFSAEIRMEFATANSGVSARSWFTFAGISHVCDVTVQWLFERYVKLDGVAADPDGCMFNTCYFQVNPAGDRIAGRYIGFGPHSNTIIVGEVSGRKDNGAG